MQRANEYLLTIYRAIRSRLLVFYYRRFCSVKFGKRVRIYSRILIHGPGKVTVQENTRFTSRRAINEICTTNIGAEIVIGQNCLLNGAIIAAAQYVSIGNKCIIAEAYIRDTSHHGITPEGRHDPSSVKTAPVILSENVWIGSHAHIMPGVTIGKNTIVGVNSVVTQSLPENVFAAGVPAKVIYRLDGANLKTVPSTKDTTEDQY